MGTLATKDPIGGAQFIAICSGGIGMVRIPQIRRKTLKPLDLLDKNHFITVWLPSRGWHAYCRLRLCYNPEGTVRAVPRLPPWSEAPPPDLWPRHGGQE